jgi:hypothetical protein
MKSWLLLAGPVFHDGESHRIFFRERSTKPPKIDGLLDAYPKG